MKYVTLIVKYVTLTAENSILLEIDYGTELINFICLLLLLLLMSLG